MVWALQYEFSSFGVSYWGCRIEIRGKTCEAAREEKTSSLRAIALGASVRVSVCKLDESGSAIPGEVEAAC